MYEYYAFKNTKTANIVIVHLIILRVHELCVYFFCQFWSNNLNNVKDVQYILVLLYHFASFVMPWFVAFFFEFKVKKIFNN